MSPRFGKLRYRKPAGGNSTGGSSATPLVIEVRFNGLSQDYNQCPTGTTSVQWSKAAGSTSFPQIAGLGPATGDNNSNEVLGDQIFKDGGKSGSTGDGFFRHNTAFGVNQGGGSIALDFSTYGGPFPELWMKWWERYPSGLRPTSGTSTGNGSWGYNKDIELNNDGLGGRVIFGQRYGNIGSSGHLEDWGAEATDHGNTRHHANLVSTGLNWMAQMGGQENGDDVWHSYQIHIVKDSGTNDGVFAAWFDGVKVSSHSTCQWSSGVSSFAGFRHLRISNNQNKPGSNSTSFWQDYACILISTTGYITQD